MDATAQLYRCVDEQVSRWEQRRWSNLSSMTPYVEGIDHGNALLHLPSTSKGNCEKGALGVCVIPGLLRDSGGGGEFGVVMWTGPTGDDQQLVTGHEHRIESGVR